MEYDENVIAMIEHGRKPALKVYVACSSKELDRAERAMSEIRRRGGTITFDWTPDVRQWGPQAPNPVIGLRCAMADLNGVRDADVVLVLDGELSYGRTIEHGAALALGKTLVVSGPALGRIWETLEHARVDDDAAAIDAVFSRGCAIARHAATHPVPSPVRFELGSDGQEALVEGIDICAGKSVREVIKVCDFDVSEEHAS
jgi:hypothetical protein